MMTHARRDGPPVARWSALAFVGSLVSRGLLRRTLPEVTVRDLYEEALRPQGDNVKGLRDIILTVTCCLGILRLVLLALGSMVAIGTRFAFLLDYPILVGLIATGVLAGKAEFLRRGSKLFLDRVSWREDVMVLAVFILALAGGDMLVLWADSAV